MAMPQYAMAQAGSRAAIRVNCRSASSYQKSCSSATPRLKGARIAGAQDTPKVTVPSFSSGSIGRLTADGAAPGGAAPSGDHGASASAIKHRVKHFMAIPLFFRPELFRSDARLYRDALVYLEALGYFEASTSAIGVAARGTAVS